MKKIDIFNGSRDEINDQANAWIASNSPAKIVDVKTSGNSVEGFTWVIKYYKL